MKKVTMSDVASHAGVSKSTVSQYINKRYDFMSEVTKDRIEASIKELGYRPNIVARSLKQKSTYTIGVIVSNILHAFSTQVIRSIEDTCHAADFHVIVCNADDNPVKEKRYIQMLRDKQVDGLIVFPTGENRELYEEMVQTNYPVVFVDRKMEGLPILSVLLENSQAMNMAVNHLIENGHRKIALLTNSINFVLPRQERVNAFRALAKLHDLPINDRYIVSKELKQLQSSLHELIQQEEVDAVIAGNDLVLYEVLNYVKQHQLKLPDAFALVSIDDVSFGALYSPPLTAVAQPAAEMGKKAGELLLAKIKGEEPQEQTTYLFEPIFIERKSCGEGAEK